MENSADWEKMNLINELTQGRELAKQLQFHLNVSYSSHEARELLVHKILNSYDKALSMLKCVGASSGEPQLTIGTAIAVSSESPRSFIGSPHSEDSDRDSKDQEHKDGSRKRKCVPRWTKQVQVCPGSGLEGTLDDGHSWRKYGQKDILGAKYPRGYYRCSHRNVQGCLATKQVQRSDEDPTIFEINYRGRHTCTPTQGSYLTPPQSSSSPSPPDNREPRIIVDSEQFAPLPQQNQQEILLNFQTGLKVVTENLNTPDQSFSSFLFPSTSNTKAENYAFSSAMIDNSLVGNYSPSFMSPATPGSNYFSGSQTHMNSVGRSPNLSLPSLNSLGESQP
ncbi:unnamed protein product [Ilex paraguariensis]|uniref:WRKY domain-containing protein n=1 Tax=Ilex paraguariensis TaxID=185542 RepID=A0ABC8U298_9AQUA